MTAPGPAHLYRVVRHDADGTPVAYSAPLGSAREARAEARRVKKRHPGDPVSIHVTPVRWREVRA